jgi:hypothetical protein
MVRFYISSDECHPSKAKVMNKTSHNPGITINICKDIRNKSQIVKKPISERLLIQDIFTRMCSYVIKKCAVITINLKTELAKDLKRTPSYIKYISWDNNLCSFLVYYPLTTHLRIRRK